MYVYFYITHTLTHAGTHTHPHPHTHHQAMHEHTRHILKHRAPTLLLHKYLPPPSSHATHEHTYTYSSHILFTHTLHTDSHTNITPTSTQKSHTHAHTHPLMPTHTHMQLSCGKQFHQSTYVMDHLRLFLYTGKDPLKKCPRLLMSLTNAWYIEYIPSSLHLIALPPLVQL